MRRACLVGAIADAVSEVSVGAVASYITDGASESRVGDLNHVVDAGLLLKLSVMKRREEEEGITYTASGKRANVLGDGQTSGEEDESGEGLHCEGG